MTSCDTSLDHVYDLSDTSLDHVTSCDTPLDHMTSCDTSHLIM